MCSVLRHQEIDMDTPLQHTRRLLVLDVLLICVLLVAGVATAQEVGRTPPEVGESAPDFTLPSTTGEEISLSEFRGKKHVLLEFYGVDFAPT
jgi:cytochrome oxidase Cu insertion factor (SCO1/SenC/PrrC family)